MSIKIKHFDFPLLPAVVKYLKKYGLNHHELILPNESKYEAVVVIPALGEYKNIKKLLTSLLKNSPEYFDKFLFLFVVNNTLDISSDIIENNAKSIEFLERIINGTPKNEFDEKLISSGLNFGLIDASSVGKELPQKTGGVGLARKIGMDFALTVFDYDAHGKRFLVCLDSDCTVEKNYLSAIYNSVNEENISAGYVRFEHPVDINPFSEAIILYEIFLRYYVLGLKFARSPYAFYTIGSTMISDYDAYISVEGMNKKKAAEDFYFMEKLAKRFNIIEIAETAVYPSPRSSWRVPFGTGKAVDKFLKSEKKEFRLHSPKSFLVLKEWLSVFNKIGVMSANDLLNKAELIHPELKNFLHRQKFEKIWTKILASSKTSAQLEKQKKLWFDGFTTLKLIHHLRDNAYPDVDGFAALHEMLKMNNYDLPMKQMRGNISSALQYLKVLREKV